MVDERVVAVKLEQIEQYHGELAVKQAALSRSEFLKSTTQQRAVERMFENAIQACSDLAQHVATRGFGYDGSTAKEAVRVQAVKATAPGLDPGVEVDSFILIETV